MAKQCYNSDGQYRTGYAYSYQDSCVELHQDGAQGLHGGPRRHSGDRSNDSWIIQLKCGSTSPDEDFTVTDRLWQFGQLLNQTIKTLNLNLCFSAQSDLGPVDAEAVLGGDGGPGHHPLALLDLFPCLCSQRHPAARVKATKVSSKFWTESWKYWHCFAHKRKKIMESENDCDPSVIVIMMERTQSDTQSKVSCCADSPSWAYIDHHWWRLSWTFLFLSIQFDSWKQSVKTLIFSSRFNSLIWKEVLSLQFIWNKVGSGIL